MPDLQSAFNEYKAERRSRYYDFRRAECGLFGYGTGRDAREGQRRAAAAAPGEEVPVLGHEPVPEFLPPASTKIGE